ncbi:tetratricopeptide repeat protein [Trinickia acidisoli]|uniref:tetratricopeptide repeat protein n=1 Tax=Trinickia acidisoli TaxID=2767482 RepID=UPI001A8D4BD4|nr:tetratricopeptide repeat protein [Trinickia acidisoli]
MSQLLISFCFTSPPGHALAKLDVDSERLEWIDLAHPDFLIDGAMGISRYRDGYVVVFHATRDARPVNCIGEFDGMLSLKRLAPLPSVHDGHSVIEHDGALLVVSSGTNQVIRVDWPDGAAPRERVFFEIDPGDDTLHMNSLQTFDGKLFLSMFGNRGSSSWRDAANGRVVRLDDGVTVAEGLHHPHGLFVDDGSLLCLASATGDIRRVGGAARGASAKLEGYLRGIASDARFVYVGTSRLRNRSKSTGKKQGVPLVETGVGCGLHLVDKAAGTSRWLDLSPFASEIYDVFPLPEGTPIEGTREAAMLSRLRALNAHTPILMVQATQAEQYFHEFNGVIGELIAERDFDTAATLLERLMCGPLRTRLDWHADYALCLLHRGDMIGAMQHYAKALGENHPRLTEIQSLALASLQSGNRDDAIHQLRKSLAIMKRQSRKLKQRRTGARPPHNGRGSRAAGRRANNATANVGAAPPQGMRT